MNYKNHANGGDKKSTMFDQIKAKLNNRASRTSKGQTGAVVALLLALIGGLIVAIFHVNTVEPVANASGDAANSNEVSGGAEALLNEYGLIYVAAGMIGFFVLIMNAAT